MHGAPSTATGSVRPYPITAFGCATALGATTEATLAGLAAGHTGLGPLPASWNMPFETWYGVVPGTFAPLPPHLADRDSVQHRLCQHVFELVGAQAREAVARWGADRVAVLVGTTTGGIADTERHYPTFRDTGAFPPSFRLDRQHLLEGSASVIAALAGATGPRFTQSSACSSSLKVFGTARRLLDTGLCDAVLVAGVDSRCRFTLLGFQGLEVLSSSHCRPFGAHRDGINLGEGGGIAVVERSGTALAWLTGVGESSDAHHMTQPHPEGRGLASAMRMALGQAGATQVDLVNAHATGTRYNDAAEAAAIATLLPDRPPVVGTKGYTGHTLGACGAVEVALCLLALQHGWSPGTLTEPSLDPEIDVDVRVDRVEGPFARVLCTSAAFAGHNAAVLVEAP
ncbi:MAG: beta-ketoacyl-[acyl-carrier-protein] synthase II [Alphaproteobacteria bacterium]|nr:beta-ketoacyl-[acyl-carrier-protein] synthase II [Alphaproteobacteria bacterium]